MFYILSNWVHIKTFIWLLCFNIKRDFSESSFFWWAPHKLVVCNAWTERRTPPSALPPWARRAPSSIWTSYRRSWTLDWPDSIKNRTCNSKMQQKCPLWCYNKNYFILVYLKASNKIPKFTSRTGLLNWYQEGHSWLMNHPLVISVGILE